MKRRTAVTTHVRYHRLDIANMCHRVALLALILTSASYPNHTTAFIPSYGPARQFSPLSHVKSSATTSSTSRCCNRHAAAADYGRPGSGCTRPGFHITSQHLAYSMSQQHHGARWCEIPMEYRRHRRRRGAIASAASTTVGDIPQDTDYEPERSQGRSLAANDPKVQRFEEWARRTTNQKKASRNDAESGTQAGGRAKIGLVHADFEGLRGLMTDGAAPPWEPLVTLPLSSALQENLVPDTARSSPLEPFSVESWEQCPWWVRLGVRLLKEKALGEKSSFREYVELMLPDGKVAGGMGTPLNWSKEQLERLYYPRLLSQIKVQRRLFEGFRVFLLADASRCTDSDSDLNKKTSESESASLVAALSDPVAFSWALECVSSRAFQLPPEHARRPVFESADGDADVPARAPELESPTAGDTRMALLPMIDSMNHYGRMPTTMYWEDDGASVSVAIGVNLDPGDQVFLSYGLTSNDDLLQYYGFVERDNPSDTYVLQDMGNALKEDGLLTADLTTRLLSCPGARETWRYLRKGVLLRDAVHPATMQAVRVVCCEPRDSENVTTAPAGDAELKSRPWDGTESDLARFRAPISLASEIAAFELIMRYSAQEADAWGTKGRVACALAEDPTAAGLDGDLDGLGMDDDRRLMLSVFRQEKVGLLRGIVSRLTHMRKISGMLQRPLKMPAVESPPPVLGASVRY